MRHQGPGSKSIHDEESLGKVYDARIMKRLLKFATPYKKLILAAIVVLLLTSGADIFLPYLSKIGIDNYIIFNNRKLQFGEDSSQEKEIISKYSEFIYILNGPEYYVDAGKLEIQDSRKLEDEGILSTEKYYIIETDGMSREQSAKLENAVGKYPELFRYGPGLYAVSYDNLQQIPRTELLLIRNKDLKGVVKVGFVYLGVLLLNFILGFLHVYLTTYTGQKIMFDIRVNLFKHAQQLSLSYFSRNPIGRLVTRTTNDIEVLNEMFTSVLINLFKDVFLLIGIIVIMLVMNWQLALVCFAIVPLIVAVTLYFKIRVRDAFRVVRIKIARINATLAEYINGIRIIKIFVREAKNLNFFKVINEEHYQANLRQLFIQAVFSPIIQILSALGIAVIVWYGGGKVVQNIMSLGSLVAFLAFIEMFFRPIRDISEKYNIMQSSMASAERVFQFLDQDIEIKNSESAIRLDNIRGDIEFQGVWFAYESEDYVLKDVSFKIKPGQKIAFVGATGAGKSTIINLLSRFYEVQKGRILVDGYDIKDLDKFSLRSHIGVVLQDVFLFATTIEHNIRLNNEGFTPDELEQVARLVNANTFIDKLPDGYQEEIKEGGATLSMGQRQLLAFARALAYDPRILVLDEATSSIDTETEQLIQEALEHLMEGRTSIIIAHRLSTIQKADKIIVIHKGRIREAGTHQELLTQKGLYFNLYQLQYKDQFFSPEATVK
ncbi:ABC transporter ATP-binding protein [bacterium]|nr:ABC transporter ATP-binding protein [bacterium]